MVNIDGQLKHSGENIKQLNTRKLPWNIMDFCYLTDSAMKEDPVSNWSDSITKKDRFHQGKVSSFPVCIGYQNSINDSHEA